MPTMKQANIHRSENYLIGWFQCDRCGKEWEPPIQYGGKYLNNWWLCPNGCNVEAGKLKVLNCKRCHYEWGSRGVRFPRHCPNCKSPYWNIDKWKNSGNFKKKTLQGNLFGNQSVN
jgi:hypothetical protein